MIQHILVAYDGSVPADKAFVFGLELAQKYQAKLSVLAVVRFPEPAEDVETKAMVENAKLRFQKLFISLKKQAKKINMGLNCHVAVGHPAEQIVSYAERMEADHIVMGHRGHTLFNRWLLGSVAKQVMIYAHCAITVVQ